MREMFALFDPDGDGAISGLEVSHTLIHDSGLDVPEEEASQLIEECDDDGNGGCCDICRPPVSQQPQRPVQLGSRVESKLVYTTNQVTERVRKRER